MSTTVPSAPSPKPRRQLDLVNMARWYLWFGKVTLLATMVWIIILLAAEHAG